MPEYISFNDLEKAVDKVIEQMVWRLLTEMRGEVIHWAVLSKSAEKR